MEIKLHKILLLFFLVFSSSLFADLVTLYRTMGIEEVKKELERQLRTKEYWASFIGNMDVQYGYYESKKYVIVANKSSKKLELFEKKDKKFLKVLTENMISGDY